MVQDVDRVVEGDLVYVSSVIDPIKNGTVVRMAVTRTWYGRPARGKAADHVEVVFPGGYVADGTFIEVMGLPHPIQGTHVTLMLRYVRETRRYNLSGPEFYFERVDDAKTGRSVALQQSRIHVRAFTCSGGSRSLRIGIPCSSFRMPSCR